MRRTWWASHMLASGTGNPTRKQLGESARNPAAGRVTCVIVRMITGDELGRSDGRNRPGSAVQSTVLPCECAAIHRGVRARLDGCAAGTGGALLTAHAEILARLPASRIQAAEQIAEAFSQIKTTD
jgi:hypothetical protein